MILQKKYIETGNVSILGTAEAFYGSDDEYKQGVDMESEANPQALKTMYRKDRRELLKNSEPDENNQYSKRYYDGLKKYSRTYQKIKDSIEKEKSYFDY